MAVRGVGEKELAVKYLGKILVQIHTRGLAAEAEDVVALYPANGVHEVDVVLVLRLVAERSGPDFKTGTLEDELVDGVGHAVGRAVDSQVGGGHRRHVAQDIVDVDEAEAEFIDEVRREQVSLGNIQEPRFDRGVKREVQRRRTDTAGQGAAQRFLQVAGAEGKKAFGIGEEKPDGNFVLAAAEFAVPVGGELIVVITSLTADGEGAGCGVAAGNQETVGGATELIALELKQLEHHRIDGRRGVAEKRLGNRGLRAVRGKRRNGGADESTWRKAADLPRALIVDEEIAELFLHDGPAHAAAKNILFDSGSREALAVEEEIVCVQHVVAEKLVYVAMIGSRSGLQNRVDVAAAIASLTSVVERGLHLKFLDHIGIRKWHVGRLGHVVVRGTDTFDQVIVVVLALAVHE